MARVTPPIGAIGVYTLKAPWNTVAGMSYRCVSLRRAEELVKSGRDVFKTVYEPMGLTQETADLDAAQGMVLVGLLSTDGVRIYVPDTYIESYPDQSAVIYDYTVMSIDLGPQPSTVDLTMLLDEVKQLSADFTGIDIEDIAVYIGRNQSNTVMTQEQYIAAEDARKLKLQNIKPTSQVIAEKDARIAQQDVLINTLLEQIKTLSNK